jgi:V-type H+-transporting ATPase subunit A
MIREDFLQQNSYTDYDRYCPLWKTIAMVRNIVTFHDLAQKAVTVGTTSATASALGETEHKATYMHIKSHTADVLAKLSMMKMVNVSKFEEEEQHKQYFHALNEEVIAAFASLSY